MKVFAIASIPSNTAPEQIQQHMPGEVHDTLRLYLGGKVEQFWFRDKSGPIFLMEVESVEQARDTLQTLPLVAANLMTYELLPVSPLLPLGRLIPAA